MTVEERLAEAERRNREWAEFLSHSQSMQAHGSQDEFESMMADYRRVKAAQQARNSAMAAVAEAPLGTLRSRRAPLELPEFVQRMGMRNPPSIENEDGSRSTHEMASAQVGDSHIAYPTVVNIDGKLVRLGDNEALDYALKTGEYREFQNEQQAQQFAEGSWKRGLGSFYKSRSRKAAQ